MNSFEKRAVASLASIFALRMLGLFMVLPVMSIAAVDYRGSTPLMIGLAIGCYGLTQALLQIPFGYWSDRLGRKPMLLCGLALFFLGSLVAALAESMAALIVGRCLQGSGAIASVLTAFIGDVTREQYRTRAMAMVGAGIGVSFAIALVVGPMLTELWSLSGLFYIIAGLALLSVVLVLRLPGPPKRASGNAAPSMQAAFKVGFSASNLRLLNGGVFMLHLLLTANFLVLPKILLQAWGVPVSQHGWIYLATLLGSFALMVPAIIYSERRVQGRPFLRLAALMLLVSQVLLATISASFVAGIAAIVVFFTAFNYLEASLPSELSKRAPDVDRGAAMGAFSSSQFLGAFFGGTLGGWLLGSFDQQAVYWLGSTLAGLWLVALARQERAAVSPQNPERSVPHH